MRISDWSSDVCSSDLLVFLLCGLWHGASWTFVLWGAWHGGFLVLERMGLGTALRRAPRPLGWAYALVAVVFGWVLFRGADLGKDRKSVGEGKSGAVLGSIGGSWVIKNKKRYWK